MERITARSCPTISVKAWRGSGTTNKPRYGSCAQAKAQCCSQGFRTAHLRREKCDHIPTLSPAADCLKFPSDFGRERVRIRRTARWPLRHCILYQGGAQQLTLSFRQLLNQGSPFVKRYPFIDILPHPEAWGFLKRLSRRLPCCGGIPRGSWDV